MLLLPAAVGGYTVGHGWDPDSRVPVPALRPAADIPEESVGSDSQSAIPAPLTIAEHTDHVCAELEAMLATLPSLPPDIRNAVRQAGRWHDAGKAHAVFQTTLRKVNPSLAPDELWAKSGRTAPLRHERKHFRHELASALAAWQQALPFTAAYLVAAHHGRSRLSIRSLPGEEQPQGGRGFALGIYQGDELPEVRLGPDETCPPLALDLSPMQLGGERSWTAEALNLLTTLGPFKLAYLESLLRAVDMRVSRKEADRG